MIPNNKNETTLNNVYIGQLEGGVNICKGYSGGPLITQKSPNDQNAIVIGIASSIRSFCSPNKTQHIKPIFTKVNKYLAWIRNKMEGEKNSCDVMPIPSNCFIKLPILPKDQRVRTMKFHD